MTLAFNMFFFPWVAATASNPVGWEVPPPDLVPPKRVYSPTRLPLAVPYLPGSVSWQIPPPDLPRPVGWRAAGIMLGAPGIELPYIVPPAGFLPDTPATLRGRRLAIPSIPDGPLGGRVGLEWGFLEGAAVPSLLPARRHAYAELPRLDTPQLTLSGIDWVSGSPPRARAKRDPVDLPRFDAPQLTLGGVDLVQGSPPSARPKRHPLDLASVDFPQLASPFNWQPVCEPPIRAPYRSVALHRDFGIEAAFNEPRLAGWANDPPPLTRPRYRPSDPGWSGDLKVAALATAALEWGFEVVAVVPSRHPFFRAGAGFPYWFGDVGKYIPPTPAGLTAWVPDNEIQILRPRSGGFRQILIMGGEVSGIFFPSPATPGGQIPQSGFFSNFGRLMNRGTR